MLTLQEVGKHASRQSCWVVISGHVYDVTDFLDEHPGGAGIILRYAGKDATEAYEPVHPPGLLDTELTKEQHLGPVAAGQKTNEPAAPQPATDASSAGPADHPLMFCVNLDDFEANAKAVASARAWTYYSSAADDLITYHRNAADWKRISFRPRVLRDVKRVSMRQNILGTDFALPFFIAPAALGRLGHPDGELCLARGAASWQVPYAVSSGASLALKDIMEASAASGGSHGLWYQLYVRKDRQANLNLISEARQLGYAALLVTVDTPVVGKREVDDRQKAQAAYEAGERTAPVIGATGQSTENDDYVFRGPYSSSFTWDDLKWIRETWRDQGPICLKGITSAEDAKLASELGYDNIYLSNHGGRQLDASPSSLMTLMEIRRLYPELLTKCQILVDGGARRGQDALKALCLGARAVGIGRPFMFAMTGYGVDGVSKALQILSEELQTAMRLLGVTSLADLRPWMVNAKALEADLPATLGPVAPIASRL